MQSTKSQVTVFIIIGILLVAGFMTWYLMYLDNIKQPDVMIRPSGEVDTNSLTATETKGVWFNGTSRTQRSTPSISIIASNYNGYSDKMIFFIVPVNYAITNPDFNQRAGAAIQALKSGLKLSDDQFVIVDQPFNHIGPSQRALGVEVSCMKVANPAKIWNHVSIWHQKKFGRELPGATKQGNVLAYSFRVIGIDSWVQDINECGCGFAPAIYEPDIYIGGHECGRAVEAISHEVGHTFGMCDEYDTCVWDDWNNIWLKEEGGCTNLKPSKEDSTCYGSAGSYPGSTGTYQGCCASDRACCQGKFAIGISNPTIFNVMGAVGSSGVTYQMSNEFTLIQDVYSQCFSPGRSGKDLCKKIYSKEKPKPQAEARKLFVEVKNIQDDRKKQEQIKKSEGNKP